MGRGLAWILVRGPWGPGALGWGSGPASTRSSQLPWRSRSPGRAGECGVNAMWGEKELEGQDLGWGEEAGPPCWSERISQPHRQLWCPASRPLLVPFTQTGVACLANSYSSPKPQHQNPLRFPRTPLPPIHLTLQLPSGLRVHTPVSSSPRALEIYSIISNGFQRYSSKWCDPYDPGL